MKKIISGLIVITLATMLFVPVAIADSIDLSNMSWDELIALSQQINRELMLRPEFKEVTVPVGAYKVGEDIPVGKWTITSTRACDVYWGKSLDVYGVDIPSKDEIAHLDAWGEGKSVTWNLVEGTYILVKMNPVVFTPYVPIKLGF